MNVNYGHDTNNNFMIIKLPFEELSYKLKMIEKNEISGLLKMKYTILDEEIVLKYNISSKIAIRDLYSKEKIKINQLRVLIQGIVDVWKLIPNYLLEADNIILTDDMIFIDLNLDKIFLCYCPGYKKDLYMAFHDLIQGLLLSVDYNDVTAVEVIYKVNEWCNIEYNEIDKLKKIVEEEYIPARSEDIIKKDSQNEIFDAGQNYFEYNNSILGKINPFIRILKKLKEKFSKFKFEVLNGMEPYKECSVNKEYSEETENITNETLSFGDNSDNETILVSAAMRNHKRSLISICGIDNILIKNYPFLIGKLEKNVDGVIRHNSISRVQARIQLTDNKYFLEDLNSKNGTYVNEERIEPYEIVEIKIGDKIGFAEIDFFFR
ncbi:MAG: FHA domain-containing protein [Lachnospiraceae bacterium]|nr:FHA domain-containing protein [Lachnospiraceae bacterium]